MKGAIFHPQSSILDPRSFIFDFRSSDFLLGLTPNRIAVFGAEG